MPDPCENQKKALDEANKGLANAQSNYNNALNDFRDEQEEVAFAGTGGLVGMLAGGLFTPGGAAKKAVASSLAGLVGAGAVNMQSHDLRRAKRKLDLSSEALDNAKTAQDKAEKAHKHCQKQNDPEGMSTEEDDPDDLPEGDDDIEGMSEEDDDTEGMSEEDDDIDDLPEGDNDIEGMSEEDDDIDDMSAEDYSDVDSTEGDYHDMSLGSI